MGSASEFEKCASIATKCVFMSRRKFSRLDLIKNKTFAFNPEKCSAEENAEM